MCGLVSDVDEHAYGQILEKSWSSYLEETKRIAELCTDQQSVAQCQQNQGAEQWFKV